MEYSEKKYSISLTARQWDLIEKNADGWLDAGACEGGLEEDERDALMTLCHAVSKVRQKDRK